MYDKNNHVAHILTLKQALNHRLMLKTCIKEFNLMKKHGLNHILILILNEEQKQNMSLKKTFFKPMFFGKTVENIGKLREIKLVITNKRNNFLVLEPHFYTVNKFSENLIAIEMKKSNSK